MLSLSDRRATPRLQGFHLAFWRKASKRQDSLRSGKKRGFEGKFRSAVSFNKTGGTFF